jgi:membrane protease subunit (stomatin/prohibitin family)
LTMIVQEPRGAANFNVSPAGRPFVDSEGFNSFQYNYPGLDKDKTLNFTITYEKSDTRPSLEITDSGNSGSVAFIILIIFGVALIGTFFWIRQTRAKQRTARRSQAKNRAATKPADGQLKTRFCSQCGRTASDSDVFCSHCGAKLRRS